MTAYIIERYINKKWRPLSFCVLPERHSAEIIACCDESKERASKSMLVVKNKFPGHKFRLSEYKR